MADEEQLAILKQGGEVWNKWREENPEAVIDLRKANLIKADLRGATFGASVLLGLDLSAAVGLEGAELERRC